MIALTTSGCKKCDDPTDPECPNYCVDETNPECPNYDPCWDQTPVSADFRLIENGSNGLIKLSDTLYPGYDSVRRFYVITDAIHKKPDWKYTWVIGAGTYDSQQTALDYVDAPKGVPIGVTLMVEGPPNTTCFPYDDGRDTATQFFYRERHANVDTTEYAGYRDGNLQDSIRILFYYDYAQGTGRLAGFFEGCDAPIGAGAGTYKTTIRLDGSTGCNLLRATLVHDPDRTGDFKKVRCTYSYVVDMSQDPSNYVRTSHVFEGRLVRRD